MSQTDFKIYYQNEILNFLWRQWSALGVAGGSKKEDNWIIDPESLLVFSLQMARFEPRLFDEILDWVVINAKWIDNQRLRRIIKERNEETQRLFSAVACMTSERARTYQRKWQPLSEIRTHDRVGAYGHVGAHGRAPLQVLFRTKEGRPFPEPKNHDQIFMRYGFLRETFDLRRMSKEVSNASPSNLRFSLRGLFGIGSRSECILYLLTHEAAHPSEMAQSIGVSTKAAQDMLVELSSSDLILTRIKGKRKLEYWLSKKRWWEFLYGSNFEDIKRPCWLDWIAVFNALESIWEVLNEIEETKSKYMRSSKLRQAMVEISEEFLKSGIEVPSVPDENVPPKEYEQAFQKFITQVLGAGK